MLAPGWFPLYNHSTMCIKETIFNLQF